MRKREQLWGTVDFYSICFPTMEVNRAPKQPGYKLSSEYRIDEIKSLSFHIMFYRLFRGFAKYIVYGNTFSSFE